MKIALTCPASLPATQFGGILFLCVDIARELSNLGHEVKIYTTDLDFANNPKTFNKKLPRHEKFENFEIIRSHVWLSIQLFFVNPDMYFQMIKANPDVIHAIGVRSFQAFIAALVSKKKNIPLVISDQGGLTTHPDLKQSGLIKKMLYNLQKPMINFVINQASKVIVANKYEEEIFSELNAKNKTAIVKNGINLQDFKLSTVDFRKKYSINEPFILFVGRFNKVKGIDVLIQAMNLIKNSPEMTNVKLVIMGVDFGFQSTMFKMISDYGLNDKILVIKNPAREDVITAYSQCEFLALPSRWELSPLTPLEGFAFKKPVISTKSHGIPHTIQDGENCILVESEDPGRLGEAIIRLLKDKELRQKLGNSGYELVKNTCNSEAMAKNILRIYQQLVA